MKGWLAPAVVLAAALLAGLPGHARGGDKDPPPPAAGQPPKPADPPKPPPEDLRSLPDAEKAKRLADIEKKYEDFRRNQDLIPVRSRRTGVQQLGKMRFAPAAKFLRRVFDDDRDMTTRIAALIAIGECGDPDTIEYAVKRSIASGKKDPVFAANLPRMFALVEDAKARDWIVTRLPQGDPEVHASVVEAIGEAHIPNALPELVKALDSDTGVAVRFEALRAIGRCGGKDAIPKLVPYLTDKDWRLRMGAVEALGFTGDPAVFAEVKRALVRTEEPIVIETAIEAFARIGTRDAVEPLIEGLRIGRLRARQKARTALKGLALSLFKQEKDYGVDIASWQSWWNKVKNGVDPEAAKQSDHETTSYFNFPVHSDRVLFILDISGSMLWPDAPRDSGIKPSDWKMRRIDVAHKEIFKALRELAKQNRGRIPKRAANDTSDLPTGISEDGKEPPTLFNVATFSGGVMSWQKDVVLATEKNAEEAILWLEKQLPRGGTATYDALSWGIEQNSVDTIFFVSDGVPSVGRFEERETILSEIRRQNRFKRISINTIALIIGLSPIESQRKYEDPDDMADLMNRIATENQGKFANESKM